MCLASLSSYPSDIILGGGYWIPMKREFKRDFRSMAKPTLQDNKHLLLPSYSLNKLCVGGFYFIGQKMRHSDGQIEILICSKLISSPGSSLWVTQVTKGWTDLSFFVTEKDPIIEFLKCQWLSEVPVKCLGKWGYLVVKGEKSFPWKSYQCWPADSWWSHYVGLEAEL